MMLQVKPPLVDDKNDDNSVSETQGPERGCVLISTVQQTIPKPKDAK